MVALRARYASIGGEIADNPLTAGATTLTSDALMALPVITNGVTYVPITLDPDGKAGAPEVAWITAHAYQANTATISRGKERLVVDVGNGAARQHEQKIRWVHSATPADAPRGDSKRRVSNDIPLNSGASSPIWTNVDTGMDIVLYDMIAGMVVTATPSFFIGNEGTTLFLDVATIVSGAPVNSFANAGAATASPPKYGISGWRVDAGTYAAIGAAIDYTIVAGDIAADGSVTFRLRYTTGTNATKTFFAGTNYAAQWSVNYRGYLV